MNFYITSLGCKLNQSEIDAMGRQLIKYGQKIVSGPEGADWCIINTCMVTHIAARKSRQLIRRMKRTNPGTKVAVTGCYAEIAPDEISELGEADLLVPNHDKDHMIDIILEQSTGLQMGRSERQVEDSTLTGLRDTRTRAFVKIQDGCNNHCTYCIVTIARGPQCSRPQESILSEIRTRTQEGYKEVVLTGVHIGSYGSDLPENTSNLRVLVEQILLKTDIARLRLSSIEPWDFDQNMLLLWNSPRLCRHLHLPLQSGSDATLRRMGRRYTTQEYADAVSLARERIPGLAITTDVIVGFPGESHEEFLESSAFVRSMSFSRIHVFKYSRRAGTVAATMPDQVTPQIKRLRSRTMIEIGEEGAQQFVSSFAGKRLAVLWENRVQTPRGLLWSGLTDNYIRGYADFTGDIHNQVLPARLGKPFLDGIFGQLIV